MLLTKQIKKLNGKVFINTQPLKFKNRRNIIMTQPVDYIHTIDEKSPLYGITKDELLSFEKNYEIVAYLGGIVEDTGVSCQFRSCLNFSDINFLII